MGGLLDNDGSHSLLEWTSSLYAYPRSRPSPASWRKMRRLARYACNFIVGTAPQAAPGCKLLLNRRLRGYPFDHAGQGETSLLMALLPEGADMSRISEDKWYSRSARKATMELGIQGRERILARLRKALGVEQADDQGARN